MVKLRAHPRCAGTILIAALMGSACARGVPTLNAVVPGTGYPRQLLAVDGTTEAASVVWDAGSGAEVVITTGLFATQYFQIPSGAAAGPHTVAIRNRFGTSSTTTVTVLGQAPFPAPRVEDVGILFMESAVGPVDMLLTVSAANLDTAAQVSVDQLDPAGAVIPRTVGPTVLWGGLPIDYQQHHSPDTFGYPVYHYAQQLVPVEAVTLGAPLRITVTNVDGQASTIVVPTPASADMLDSDGDGLLNAWEQNGYTAPSGTVIDLKTVGTHLWRKDVLIEVDHTTTVPINPMLWQRVEEVFRDAPVLNPDGSAGISVIIDRGQGPVLTNGGQELDAHDCLTLDDPAPAPPAGCNDLRSFFDFKRGFFDNDRLLLFHYVVWGNRHVNPISGESERWGNDIAITLGISADGTKLNYQLGTFIHELGHNLGLTHGDIFDNLEPYNFKVNLPSVMSYRYPGGVDTDCDLKSDGVFTYSQGTLKRLSEMFVDENIGVCDNKAANLNMNPTITAEPANLNWMGGPLNGADTDMNDDWNDFDQWGKLRLNFSHPNSQWNGD